MNNYEKSKQSMKVLWLVNAIILFFSVIALILALKNSDRFRFNEAMDTSLFTFHKVAREAMEDRKFLNSRILKIEKTLWPERFYR